VFTARLPKTKAVSLIVFQQAERRKHPCSEEETRGEDDDVNENVIQGVILCIQGTGNSMQEHHEETSCLQLGSAIIKRKRFKKSIFERNADHRIEE